MANFTQVGGEQRMPAAHVLDLQAVDWRGYLSAGEMLCPRERCFVRSEMEVSLDRGAGDWPAWVDAGEATTYFATSFHENIRN